MNVWGYVALICIGIVIGAFSGVSMTIAMLKDLVGDDFEIVKPKVKGKGNKLEIDQTNLVDAIKAGATIKKKGLFKRIKERRAAKKAAKQLNKN